MWTLWNVKQLESISNVTIIHKILIPNTWVENKNKTVYIWLKYLVPFSLFFCALISELSMVSTNFIIVMLHVGIWYFKIIIK